jgi:FMN-dependent NADH-azoreductase
MQRSFMKLLHIAASPREDRSNTLRVTAAFLEVLEAHYADLGIDTIDLFNQDLPAVAGENIENKYALMVGQSLDKKHQESWRQIEREIARFLAADVYLISTPMWNFSIPYALKYYIDAIVQPGYLFKYDEQGVPVGLVQGRQMVCITSRGGAYLEGTPTRAFDFQEPYLRTIFGFCGITDIHFINAQPMDVSLPLREQAIASAITEARSLAARPSWRSAPGAAVVENLPELKPAPLPKG